MSKEACRKAFEAKARTFYDLTRREDGHYANRDTEAAWKGWETCDQWHRAGDTAMKEGMDLELAAKTMWQGYTPWDRCTEEHKQHWRDVAKAVAEAWGLPTKQTES